MANPNWKIYPVTRKILGKRDMTPPEPEYHEGPIHGEGDNAFWGGVELPNGRILFVPYNSSYIGLYDPVAEIYTRGPYVGESSYKGAVIDIHGLVYLIPYRANSIVGIYDSNTDEYINDRFEAQDFRTGQNIEDINEGVMCQGIYIPHNDEVVIQTESLGTQTSLLVIDCASQTQRVQQIKVKEYTSVNVRNRGWLYRQNFSILLRDTKMLLGMRTCVLWGWEPGTPFTDPPHYCGIVSCVLYLDLKDYSLQSYVHIQDITYGYYVSGASMYWLLTPENLNQAIQNGLARGYTSDQPAIGSLALQSSIGIDPDYEQAYFILGDMILIFYNDRPGVYVTTFTLDGIPTNYTLEPRQSIRPYSLFTDDDMTQSVEYSAYKGYCFLNNKLIIIPFYSRQIGEISNSSGYPQFRASSILSGFGEKLFSGAVNHNNTVVLVPYKSNKIGIYS